MVHTERPPPGYDKRDHPLPHEFTYKNDLSLGTSAINSLMMTYLRTSTLSVAPSTIDVNPKHTNFAIDGGALICYDSIVQQMQIITTYSLTVAAAALALSRLRIFDQNIMGAFEDSWTPADDATTATTAEVLEVTSDTTKEDVTPAFSGTSLATEQDQPISLVTGTETAAEYNLTTDLKMESVPFDLDEIRDANQYYSIRNKIRSITGRVRSRLLTVNRNTWSYSETKFTPRNVRFGNPHLFFAKRCILPLKTDPNQVLSDQTTIDSAGHITVTCKVRFNEWNPDFNQSRK